MGISSDPEMSVLSIKERLAKIVDLSYEILCNKIASKGICVSNEASLQMQLGVILKQVGQMYELGQNEHFLIELESPQAAGQFQKSGTGKARCDILIKLKKGREEVVAAIELKYFKNSPNEAVTDNRYSAILDLSNLEQYQKNNKNMQCYEIIYTDNQNYTKSGRSKIELSGDLPTKFEYTQGRSVTLNNEYYAEWDCYKDKHYFLKIGF